MQTPYEITPVRINPHIVGWYLVNELKQLQDLMRCKKQLLETQHPLYAKKIDEIYAFSAKKKQLEGLINRKLQAYKISFDMDESLRLEEVINYFEEQLNALNAKKTMERIVVDVAYAAHEQAEKNHLNDANKMGERLFETVITHTTKEEPLSLSDALIRENPVISSNNSAVTPALSIEAAPFIPLSQKKAMTNSELDARAPTFIPLSQRTIISDSTDQTDQKIVAPPAIRPSSHQNLITSASIYCNSSKDVGSLELQSPESFENSRLYRFWLKANDQAQMPLVANTNTSEKTVLS